MRSIGRSSYLKQDKINGRKRGEGAEAVDIPDNPGPNEHRLTYHAPAPTLPAGDWLSDSVMSVVDKLVAAGMQI